MSTDIIKQRLIGSLLLLLIVASLAFFLVNKSSYRSDAGGDDNNGDQLEFAPSAIQVTSAVRHDTGIDDHHQRKSSKNEKKQTLPTRQQNRVVNHARSWIIQLGSFKVEKNAVALHEKITKIDSFNVSTDRKGHYYRVRIVIHADKQEVDKVTTRLAKKLRIKPQTFLLQ